MTLPVIALDYPSSISKQPQWYKKVQVLIREIGAELNQIVLSGRCLPLFSTMSTGTQVLGQTVLQRSRYKEEAPMWDKIKKCVALLVAPNRIRLSRSSKLCVCRPKSTTIRASNLSCSSITS